MSLTQSALWLAKEMRLPVFACGPDKRPVTQHGFHDATRDAAEIRLQFSSPGAAMIGVPTGQGAGFFVVDLDVKNGAQGLEWLAANEHRLPRTRRHKTRSGGQHMLFTWPEGRTIRNSASRVAPGVDVRGNGGYIIAPPSPGYEIADATAPVPAPAWLLELIDPPAAASVPALRPEPAPRTAGDGTRYGLTALDNECQAILSAPDGGKHDALNRAAFSIGGLVAAAELAEGPAYAALASALAGIRHRCDDFRAAEKTLHDAFRAGIAKPREAPPRLVRRVVEEYAPTRPEPPPLTEAPEHWSAEPEPDIGLQVERVEASAGGAKSQLWIDNDTWDAAAIPRRPWLAPGYLMRGAVSVLSGQGAGGKSSITVAWTISAASGEALGTFQPVQPLKVVNYNTEDDQEEQQRRYSAALMATQKRPGAVMPNIIRCGPEQIGTLFERNMDTGRITPTAAMEELEALCVESGADLLVCDPLAELHNAEENDNTAMRAVIAAFRSLAKRLHIAVLILHHDRKGNSAPGDMDRVRGASAISGAVRVMLTLTTMSEDEANKLGIPLAERRRHFRIDGAKSNYAPTQEAEWWRLAPYEIPNGEHVAACLPWEAPSPWDGWTMKDALEVLGQIRDGLPGGFKYAVDLRAGDDWAGEIITRKFAKADAHARHILSQWETHGVLIKGDHPNPRRRGHKRPAYEVDEAKFQEMSRNKEGSPSFE